MREEETRRGEEGREERRGEEEVILEEGQKETPLLLPAGARSIRAHPPMLPDALQRDTFMSDLYSVAVHD